MDDLELIGRIGRGEQLAYRTFADRHLERAVRFAARLLGDMTEAEDAVQDAFLRVWTEAARFTPRAKPSTWLYRIVHNQCVDRLRKRRPLADGALEQMRAADRPSGLMARKQTAQRVADALAALPERQKVALTLVHYESLGNVEAAEIMDLSVEALESLLARGRRALREALSELHAEQGEDE